MNMAKCNKDCLNCILPDCVVEVREYHKTPITLSGNNLSKEEYNREYMRQYRALYREKVRECGRNHYRRNRERILQRSKDARAFEREKKKGRFENVGNK